MLKLKPMGSRLIVEPIIENEVSKSGIILPDTADKRKSQFGEKLLLLGPEGH